MNHLQRFHQVLRRGVTGGLVEFCNSHRKSWVASVVSVEGGDLVVRVQNRYPKGQLWITLRKKDETEYDVGLSVPAFLQERILLSIVLKRNITLREVGEISIE